MKESMDVIVKRDAAELAQAVAEEMAEFIRRNPGALMCFAAGDTPLNAYSLLVEMQNRGEVDLKSVYYVGLDEWVGLGRETRGSCVQVMFDGYYDPARIPEDHVKVFDGLAGDLEAEKAQIEAWIQGHGGIQFTLLGIGMNGHIGFNEPGSGLPDGCILIDLDETTKHVSSKYFDSPLPVERGIGVGAGELKKAKRLVLMADATRKAAIVKQTITGVATPSVPSSLMIDHPNSAIYLDEEAAVLL